MAVMTAQAQSICGSWQSTQPKVKNNANNTHSTFYDTYTFNENGTFAITSDITYSTKPSKTMEREVALNSSVSGTYTLEGNKMVMKVDFNTLKMNVISISENGKVIDKPEMISLFNDAFNKDDTKSKAAKEFKNNTYTVNLTGNGSMLELTDATGDTDKLMRIATLKN